MAVKSLLALFLFVFSQNLSAQPADDRIRINQIGYQPTGTKIAVVVTAKAGTFSITNQNELKPLFSGTLGTAKHSTYNPAETRMADFSSFTGTGRFVLRVPGIGVSHPFTIGDGVHGPVLKAALKSYYFQRFSLPLEERFAGRWNRPASALQPVVIHPSAASASRPAGTAVPSPRGWIDAGDFNKYIVNSGITTATLLMAYEDAPGVFNTLETNIPESGNGIPDLLDETLWNIRWMLTMQDPADGGVYHKCTNANFDAMVMPHEPAFTRYLVQKSTAAALDFTSVMARAARVFGPFSKQLPGLADSCRTAAIKAWSWATTHPAVIYDQEKINREFDPDITTGTYGDGNVSDEWIWAAAEMTVLTGDAKHL
ncbi:MAG: glycoside hydrolase family 9 protein, partial [Bacteroidota bacterium]